MVAVDPLLTHLDVRQAAPTTEHPTLSCAEVLHLDLWRWTLEVERRPGQKLLLGRSSRPAGHAPEGEDERDAGEAEHGQKR